MATNLVTAAEHVRAGNLIVFPTDTVFGIGCDPFHSEALTKLYAAKHRPFKKSIPVLVSSAAKAQELANVYPIALQLIEEHWPGALTIIVPQRISFPPELSPDGSIALRLPDHTLACAVIDACGGALAVTSANISGEKPATTTQQVHALFGNDADILVIEGEAGNQPPSTIIDCRLDAPKVLRQGSVHV